MFSEKFAYHLPTPIRISTVSQNGENKSYIYKVKTANKKIPYFIQVDEFNNDVYFIKFYQKKFAAHKNKYKFRHGNVNELSRLVITCIKLAKQKQNKEPDSVFAFHGQWDNVDIDRERTVSQRYDLYKRVVFSIIDQAKYKFYHLDEINVMVIIPIHLYNQKFIGKLENQFNLLFGNRLEALVVPQKNELPYINGDI